MLSKFDRKFIFISILVIFLSPVFVSAVSLGEEADFFIDSSYDLNQREEISATLMK